MEILFIRHKSLGSRFIRWMTWSPWSHVALVVGPETVVEAVWPCVRLTTIAHATQHASSMERVSVSLPSEDLAKRFALEQVGKPYDVRALFGFLFRSRTWHDPSKWFCSELAAKVLAVGGRPLFKERYVNRITPGHMFMLNYSNE